MTAFVRSHLSRFHVHTEKRRHVRFAFLGKAVVIVEAKLLAFPIRRGCGDLFQMSVA